MQVTDVYGNNHLITVGSEVFVPCKGRGGHGAWVEVSKLKRKTFKGIERQGSYKPGTEWSIHINSCFAVVERGPNIKGWKKHWINDQLEMHNVNYAEMMTEQLKAEMNAAYARYMYEEAADRGYDYSASRKAWNKYYQVKTELEKRA